MGPALPLRISAVSLSAGLSRVTTIPGSTPPSPYLSVHPLSVHPSQGHSGVSCLVLLHPGVFGGILRWWHRLEMQLKPQPFRRVLQNAVERKPAGLNGNLTGFWSNF